MPSWNGTVQPRDLSSLTPGFKTYFLGAGNYTISSVITIQSPPLGGAGPACFVAQSAGASVNIQADGEAFRVVESSLGLRGLSINQATAGSGRAILVARGILSAEDTAIRGFKAAAASTVDGAAISAAASVLTLTNIDIIDNAATGRGGGIACDDGAFELQQVCAKQHLHCAD